MRASDSLPEASRLIRWNAILAAKYETHKEIETVFRWKMMPGGLNCTTVTSACRTLYLLPACPLFQALSNGKGNGAHQVDDCLDLAD